MIPDILRLRRDKNTMAARHHLSSQGTERYHHHTMTCFASQGLLRLKSCLLFSFLLAIMFDTLCRMLTRVGGNVEGLPRVHPAS